MNWSSTICGLRVMASLPVGFWWVTRNDDEWPQHRVGQIPDSVTPWRDTPGYSIIEGEPAPFYDWEQGDLI